MPLERLCCPSSNSGWMGAKLVQYECKKAYQGHEDSCKLQPEMKSVYHGLSAVSLSATLRLSIKTLSEVTSKLKINEYPRFLTTMVRKEGTGFTGCITVSTHCCRTIKQMQVVIFGEFCHHIKNGRPHMQVVKQTSF